MRTANDEQVTYLPDPCPHCGLASIVETEAAHVERADDDPIPVALDGSEVTPGAKIKQCASCFAIVAVKSPEPKPKPKAKPKRKPKAKPKPKPKAKPKPKK